MLNLKQITNLKGPMLVPKSEIVYVTYMLINRLKAPNYGTWTMVDTHDGIKAYVSIPNSQRGRNYKI